MQFQKSQRLRCPAEFEAVFSGQSWRCSTEHLSLSCLVRTAGSSARLGLVVGKRAAKRAVVRNRVKRVVREAFRQQAAGLPAVDCIVRAHRPLPVLTEQAFKRLIRSEIDAALQRVIRRFVPAVAS